MCCNRQKWKSERRDTAIDSSDWFRSRHNNRWLRACRPVLASTKIKLIKATVTYNGGATAERLKDVAQRDVHYTFLNQCCRRGKQWSARPCATRLGFYQASGMGWGVGGKFSWLPAIADEPDQSNRTKRPLIRYSSQLCRRLVRTTLFSFIVRYYRSSS